MVYSSTWLLQSMPSCPEGVWGTLGELWGALGTTGGRFYGFTDFRGKPARRGRGRRGSANQVTAGVLCVGTSVEPVSAPRHQVDNFEFSKIGRDVRVRIRCNEMNSFYIERIAAT